MCRFGHREGYINAKVVGWLPVEESEYTNDKGEPAALWHILRDDGEVEDMEESEVIHFFMCVICTPVLPFHTDMHIYILRPFFIVQGRSCVHVRVFSCPFQCAWPRIHLCVS